MHRTLLLAATAMLAVSPATLGAQDKAPQTNPGRPVFDADGTVHVPAFNLPASELSSPEARAAQAARSKRPGSAPPNDIPVDVMRRGLEAMLAPQVAEMRKLYPVDIWV